jgi:hypothetical protein
MTRARRIGTSVAAMALAMMGLAVTPLMTTIATAQGAPATFKLGAGEEKEICAGVKAAVTPDPPQNGTLRTDGDPKGDAPIKIFYKAKDASAAVSDTLTCTSGAAGQEKKSALKIEIAPKQAAAKDTSTGSARNNTTGFSDDVYPEAFKALFLLFVIATVLESALAILFNWRPFVETFNARAVRPVVSMAMSLVLVFMFKLDIVTGLANLISPHVPELDWTGKMLTAMVIAGGSAAVNNLLVTLGFRQVRTPETAVAKPPSEKGWISVSIVRTPLIQGPVTVGIGVASNGLVPVVASLDGSTRPGYRYFLRDRGRFPGSGGYAIKKGETVTVKVRADKVDGQAAMEKTWGPEVIGDGAIIDLTFTMRED